MSCLFNSYDPYFKQPFGAVRAGQTVHLTLCIPEELGYVDPHLVLQKEGKYDVPVHYRMKFDGQTPHQNHFSVDVVLGDPGLYFYYFDLYTDFRRIVRGADNCGVVSWQEGESWQITVYEPDFQTPECIKGKVFYQIFPDRFCEGIENKPMPFPDRLYQADKHAEPFWQPNETGGHLNEDYFGGDLEGIRIKLPYLREMGVDYLYLNPIFEAHSNHRYNTADYLNVDPLLGTNEEFEVLCREAAKYGIGIVLDGVFSHTGSDSRYFNREGRYGEGGAYRDPNSPYRSWYDFDPKYKGGYRSWWGFETLPEVNEETPSFVEFITGEGGVIDTWLRRGAAGFRLDVADELPDEFIEKIRTAVKRVSPEKFLLGEVWEDATTKFGFDHRRTYLLGKGLDSVMNYPFKNSVLDFVKGKPAQQEFLRADPLDSGANLFNKVVRQLVGHIQTEACGTAPQPCVNDTALAGDELHIGGVLFVHLGQGLEAPPAAVAALILGVKIVPAAVGGVGVAVSAAVTIAAFAVEIAAVGTGVAEHTVQHDANAVLGGLAAEHLKLLVGAQQRVYVEIVGGVVAVVGVRLKDGVEVKVVHPHLPQIGQLDADAFQVAAEIVLVQVAAGLVGLPEGFGVFVGLIQPVRERHGLVLNALAEPVREDLIEHLALDALRGLETGIVDGDLPLFAFLPADNAAVVRPAVDAAEVGVEVEVVEVQARVVQRQLHGKVVLLGGLAVELHAVVHRHVIFSLFLEHQMRIDIAQLFRDAKGQAHGLTGPQCAKGLLEIGVVAI